MQVVGGHGHDAVHALEKGGKTDLAIFERRTDTQTPQGMVYAVDRVAVIETESSLALTTHKSL